MSSEVMVWVSPLKQDSSNMSMNEERPKPPAVTDIQTLVLRDTTVQQMPQKTSPVRPHAAARKSSPEPSRERRLSDASLSSGQRTHMSVRTINGKRSQVWSSSSSSSSSAASPPNNTSTKKKHVGADKAKKQPSSPRVALSKPIITPEKHVIEGFVPHLSRIFEEQGVLHNHSRRIPRSGTDDISPSWSPQSISRESSRSPKFHRRVASPLRHRPRVNLTSPSLLSVLSSLTATTTTSSGSNSTVTGKSAASSSDHDIPKVKKATNPRSIPTPPKRNVPVKAEKVNVFNYLDTSKPQIHDSDGWDSSSSSSELDSDSDQYFDGRTSQGTSYTSPLSSPDLYKTFWKKPQPTRQAERSDFGISMGDEHGGSPRIIPRYQAPIMEDILPGVRDEMIRPRPVSFPPNNAHNNQIKPSSPSLTTQVKPLPPRAPLRNKQVNASITPVPGHIPVPEETKEPARGYNMLANQLSMKPMVTQQHVVRPLPLYRKFECLNHRVLLHLQDELVELEEQLEYLDGLIQKQSHSTDGTIPAASRRADTRHGGVLHFQRTETLGQIFSKLNQYNQLLASYKACNQLPAASQQDVSSYKTWMSTNTPIVESETYFLNRESDLVRLSGACPQRTNYTWYVQYLKPAVALLRPRVLLGFAMAMLVIMPSPMGRLLLLAVAVAAGSFIMVDSSLTRTM